MRQEIRLMKPFSGLWQSKAPQAPPKNHGIPTLIHHEGTNYHVLPESELTRIKGFGWFDLGMYAFGGALVGLTSGVLIGGSRVPTVVTVEKTVPVDRPVMVDRPVITPVDRNCLLFCGNGK
jgi:hypothetical protein